MGGGGGDGKRDGRARGDAGQEVVIISLSNLTYRIMLRNENEM